MPILISPSGQPVDVMAVVLSDFLSQGYRIPQAAGPEVPREPSQGQKQPLDLMTATLTQLSELPDVATVRARKIQALAKAGTLSLDTLQEEVPQADWVGLYNAGKVVWPGGLHVVKEPEDVPAGDADALE